MLGAGALPGLSTLGGCQDPGDGVRVGSHRAGPGTGLAGSRKLPGVIRDRLGTRWTAGGSGHADKERRWAEPQDVWGFGRGQ